MEFNDLINFFLKNGGITILIALIIIRKIVKNKKKQTTTPQLNTTTEEAKKETIPAGLREKLVKKTENFKPLQTGIGQIIKDLKYISAFGTTTNTGTTQKTVYYLKPSRYAQLYGIKKARFGKCYSYIISKGFMKPAIRYTFCKVGQEIIEVYIEEQETIIKKNNRIIAILEQNNIKNEQREIIGERKTAEEVIVTAHGERVAEEHVIIREHHIGTILSKPHFKLFGKKPDDHQFANTKGLHSDEAIICLGIVLERASNSILRNGTSYFTKPSSIHT